MGLRLRTVVRFFLKKRPPGSTSFSRSFCLYWSFSDLGLLCIYCLLCELWSGLSIIAGAIYYYRCVPKCPCFTIYLHHILLQEQKVYTFRYLNILTLCMNAFHTHLTHSCPLFGASPIQDSSLELFVLILLGYSYSIYVVLIFSICMISMT